MRIVAIPLFLALVGCPSSHPDNRYTYPPAPSPTLLLPASGTAPDAHSLVLDKSVVLHPNASVPVNFSNPSWGNGRSLCLDPQASYCAQSSDNNDCSCTCGAPGSFTGPCQDFWKMLDQWVGDAPFFTQGTSIEWKSAITNPVDQVRVHPTFALGGYLVLTADLPTPSYTGSIHTVHARNLQSTTTTGRLILSDGFLATYTTGAFLEVAATDAGTAAWNGWVAKQTAPNVISPTQPLAAVTVPTSVISPAEVLPVTTQITANYATMLNVNFTSLSSSIASGGDAASTALSQVFVIHADFWDPNGIGADTVDIGPGVTIYESKIDRVINLTGGARPIDGGCVNCWISAGVLGTVQSGFFWRINGGIVANTVTNWNPVGQGIALDGDVWIDTPITFPDGASVGYAYLGEPGVMTSFGGVGLTAALASGYGGNMLYGLGLPAIIQGGRFGYDPEDGGAFVAENQFFIDGSIPLNGLEAGCCYNGTTPFCNQLTTPAGLDGVCGDSGCGHHCSAQLNGVSATITENIQ